MTAWPAIVEAMYLLEDFRAEDALWQMNPGASSSSSRWTPGTWAGRGSMAKYRDLPMDLADAVLVALAERLSRRSTSCSTAWTSGSIDPRPRRFEITPEEGTRDQEVKEVSRRREGDAVNPRARDAAILAKPPPGDAGARRLSIWELVEPLLQTLALPLGMSGDGTDCLERYEAWSLVDNLEWRYGLKPLR